VGAKFENHKNSKFTNSKNTKMPFTEKEIETQELKCPPSDLQVTMDIAMFLRDIKMSKIKMCKNVEDLLQEKETLARLLQRWLKSNPGNKKKILGKF